MNQWRRRFQLDGETRNWSIGIYSEKFIVILNYQEDWAVLCVSACLWLVVKILLGSSHSVYQSNNNQESKVISWQGGRAVNSRVLFIFFFKIDLSKLVIKWFTIWFDFTYIYFHAAVFLSRDFPSSCWCPCPGRKLNIYRWFRSESGTEPNTRLRFWSLETHFSAPDTNHSFLSKSSLSSSLATAFCCAHLKLTPIMLISFDIEEKMEERRHQEHKHFSKIEITFKIE